MTIGLLALFTFWVIRSFSHNNSNTKGVLNKPKLQISDIEKPNCFYSDSEVIVFDKVFLKHPSIIVGNDIISFTYKDSIITASKAFLSDTNAIWVLYKEHGFLDFWERDEYSWNRVIKNGKSKTPIKDPIFLFFKQQGIALYDVIIYNAYSVGPANACFQMAGFSYTGIDFIFKINKKVLNNYVLNYYVSKKHFKYKILENNYW